MTGAAAGKSRFRSLVQRQLVILVVLGLMYGLARLVGTLSDIFALMGMALLMTYVLLGPVDWLEAQLSRVKLLQKIPFINNRGLAILLVYILMALLLLGVAVRTVPLLIEQVRDFAQELPHYTTRLEQLSNRLLSVIKPSAWAMRPDDHQNAMTQLGELLETHAKNAWSYLVNLGATTLSTLIYALTCLVMVFYLLLDGPSLKQGAVKLLPHGIQENADHYLDEIHSVLSRFLKTQLLLAAVMGVGWFCLFSILELKYALFLSVLMGVAAIVPVIGPWVAMLPVLLVVGFSAGNPAVGLMSVVLFAGVIYLVKEYFLLPRLFNKDLEIHPVVLIMAFLACLEMAGLAGMLLAFPLASLCSGTYQYLLKGRTERVLD